MHWQHIAGHHSHLLSVLRCLPSLQVRPALLNEQSWLRFWVEEHVLLPAGAKPRLTKSRRTFSFSKTPASIVSGIASPVTAPSPTADGGSTLQTPSAQVQSYRWVLARGVMQASLVEYQSGLYPTNRRPSECSSVCRGRPPTC
jgi:hypothetical protein